MSRAVLDLVEIRMDLTGNVSENMSEAAGMLKNTAPYIYDRKTLSFPWFLIDR